MDTAPTELNVIQVMEQRFELIEQVAIIQGRHKGELEPLLDAIRLAEIYIKDDMNKNGAQQIKSALTGDSCNFTTKTSVTVKDMGAVIGYVVEASPVPDPEAIPGVTAETWPLILAHLKQTAMWTLFNNAVNKTQVADIIKETNTTPPGVEYSSYKDLAWKRGKGAPKAAAVAAA
jgi:hypothetical protein